MGSITVTCTQDTQWPNGETGTFITTPHPITTGEVAQITTNKTDIGHIQEQLHDPATGIDKRIADLDDGKVDKVAGKQLSTEDYTTAEKAEVAKIANKVDKVIGKGLSTNDYDDDAVAEEVMLVI